MFSKLIHLSVISIFLLLVIISACTKDESEKSLKEKNTIALISEISSDTLKSYVRWLESMGTRFTLADNHLQVAMAIREKFRSLGYTDAKLDTFMIKVTYKTKSYIQYQYNVMASITGSEYPDSLTIIGAHYDNILSASSGDPFVVAYGANDNASGVAAVIEIARVMKKTKYKPSGTVLFVTFAAEELGLFGSYYHADCAMRNFLKIKFMLNNDMIAYQPYNDQSNWYVTIADYNNSTSIRYRAQELSMKYTFLKCKNDNTYQKQSDSYPYFLKGFKAIFFSSNVFDPNYHTLNDVSAACNFEYCKEIVKLNCSIIADRN